MHLKIVLGNLVDPLAVGLAATGLILIMILFSRLKRIEETVQRHDEADAALRENVETFKSETVSRFDALESDLKENTELTREIKGSLDAILKLLPK